MSAGAPERGGPVRVDPRCGHISVDEVTFCDMGRSLAVWSREGADLSPDTARALASALVNWSEKADARSEGQ